MLVRPKYAQLLFLYFDIPVHGAFGRSATLANLRWELDDNIAALCRKVRGGPSPHTDWLKSLREIDLEAEGLQVRLGRHDTDLVWSFWTLTGSTTGRLQVTALEQAVHSGAFLVYGQDGEVPTAGPVYVAMRDLLAAIGQYRRVAATLEEHRSDLTTLMQALTEKRPEVEIAKATLVYLFAAYDRLTDIMRLSTAILRDILDPSAVFRAPQMRPMSPLHGAIEGLQAERATHEDVERWVNDPFLWSWMTGEHVYGADDIEVSREALPEFWKPFDEEADRRARHIARYHFGEFKSREATAGFAAAQEWLFSLPCGDDERRCPARGGR